MQKNACNVFFFVLSGGMANTMDIYLTEAMMTQIHGTNYAGESLSLTEVSENTYQGSDTIGALVQITVGDQGTDEARFSLLYLFETLNFESETYGPYPLTVNQFISFLMPDGIEQAATAEVTNIDPPPPPPTPPPTGVTRGDIPKSNSTLVAWASGFNSALQDASLASAIEAAATAQALADAPSTNTIVTRDAARTAFLQLRKNLTQLIGASTGGGKPMPKVTQLRPKVGLKGQKIGVIELTVTDIPPVENKWLKVELWDTPEPDDEDALVLTYSLTAPPFNLNLKKDDDGHSFVGVKTVYLRSRWEGSNNRGGWVGPWSQWMKINLIEL
jgi:hypothetical protein